MSKLRSKLARHTYFVLAVRADELNPDREYRVVAAGRGRIYKAKIVALRLAGYKIPYSGVHVAWCVEAQYNQMKHWIGGSYSHYSLWYLDVEQRDKDKSLIPEGW